MSKKVNPDELRRGDICFVKLDGAIESEQGGMRPCVILQNNVGNRHSPTTIVAPLTSGNHKKAAIPTHVEVSAEETNGLKKDSFVLLEQVRTVSKKRIVSCIGALSDEVMVCVNKALAISFALPTA